MKIVLAGSMAFFETMQLLSAKLESLGHSVKLPSLEDDLSPVAIRRYNENAVVRIAWADTLVVVNEKKHSVDGYVGANTLVEIGMAYALKKPIYLLNQYDHTQPNAIELAGLTEGIIGANMNEWLDSLKKEK